MNRCGYSMHGIGAAEVGPTVSARPFHSNSEAPTTEGMICDPSETRAVDGDKIAVSTPPRQHLKHVPHASKITFALFPYRSYSDHRPPETHAGLLRSAKSPQQCNDTRRIIRNAGK